MLNINLIVGGRVGASCDARNKYFMKILLINPPGCDWRTWKALYGIDPGIPHPLPFFGSSPAKSCVAIMNQKSHENCPIAQQRRPKRIPTECGAVATFCKELRDVPNKGITSKKKGSKTFFLAKQFVVVKIIEIKIILKGLVNECFYYQHGDIHAK